MVVTTLVLEGWSARLDPEICLMVRRAERQSSFVRRSATRNGFYVGSGAVARCSDARPRSAAVSGHVEPQDMIRQILFGTDRLRNRLDQLAAVLV